MTIVVDEATTIAHRVETTEDATRKCICISCSTRLFYSRDRREGYRSSRDRRSDRDRHESSRELEISAGELHATLLAGDRHHRGREHLPSPETLEEYNDALLYDSDEDAEGLPSTHQVERVWMLLSPLIMLDIRRSVITAVELAPP